VGLSARHFVVLGNISWSRYFFSLFQNFEADAAGKFWGAAA